MFLFRNVIITLIITGTILWSPHTLFENRIYHYDDVIMEAIASQITSLTIVYSTVYSGADQSKHQSSASLAFVWGIHRGPVNSPHKWPVTRKMFPFDDVIMHWLYVWVTELQMGCGDVTTCRGTETIAPEMAAGWQFQFERELMWHLHKKSFPFTTSRHQAWE